MDPESERENNIVGIELTTSLDLGLKYNEPVKPSDAFEDIVAVRFRSGHSFFIPERDLRELIFNRIS